MTQVDLHGTIATSGLHAYLLQYISFVRLICMWILQAQIHDTSDLVQAGERAHWTLPGLLAARHQQGQPGLQAEAGKSWR